MPTTVVKRKGQMTIPVEVRRKLHLDVGDRVEFVEMDDGRFLIVPVNPDIRVLKGSIGKGASPVCVDEMNRVIRERAMD